VLIVFPQVENDLRNHDIEFELYAQNCSSSSPETLPVQAYDTYGASQWENIPDILKMYGMCSYHDWFEYLEFIDPSDKNARRNMGACDAERAARTGCNPGSFNAFESVWWDTLRPFADPGMPTLFDTRKFQASDIFLALLVSCRHPQTNASIGVFAHADAISTFCLT